MPQTCDCGSAKTAVPLQRDLITLRSQAAPQHRASSLRSACTDFIRRIQTQTIMAKIYVNGDAQEVSLPLNVTELIKQLLIENPEMVSVQVNEEFAEREDWESTQLKEGDKVDFLYFMGGGSTAYGLIDN